MMALTFKQKRQRRLPILRLLALAVVALLLLLGSNAFAKKKVMTPEGDAKIISANKLKKNQKGFGSWSFRSSTVCVDGYKFLVVATADEVYPFVQTTQFYEERNGKALPAKCK